MDHIIKYEIDWQIVRVRVKGSKTPLPAKFTEIRSFFERQRTYEAQQRIINWLGGLARGYKAAHDLESIDKCIVELTYFESFSDLPKEKFEHVDQMIKASKYSFAERFLLWKDLFKYEKDFCGRGYRHKELEALTELLWNIFTQREGINAVPEKFGMHHINGFRAKAKANAVKPENKKRFFF